MDDHFEDGATSAEEPRAAAPVEETTTVETPAAEGLGDVEDFIGEFDNEEAPDLEHMITIRTSGGDTRYVPVPEGATMTAGEALLKSSLTINSAGGFEIYLNGSRILVTDVVPAGSTMTVVASVKGG